MGDARKRQRLNLNGPDPSRFRTRPAPQAMKSSDYAPGVRPSSDAGPNSPLDVGCQGIEVLSKCLEPLAGFFSQQPGLVTLFPGLALWLSSKVLGFN